MHLEQQNRDAGPLAKNSVEGVFLGISPVNLSYYVWRPDIKLVSESFHCQQPAQLNTDSIRWSVIGLYWYLFSTRTRMTHLHLKGHEVGSQVRLGDTSRGLSGRNYVPRKYPGTPESILTRVIINKSLGWNSGRGLQVLFLLVEPHQKSREL